MMRNSGIQILSTSQQGVCSLNEPVLAKYAESFMIDDIELFQRWPVRLLLTLLPFLHGGRDGIQIHGRATFYRLFFAARHQGTKNFGQSPSCAQLMGTEVHHLITGGLEDRCQL